MASALVRKVALILSIIFVASPRAFADFREQQIELAEALAATFDGRSTKNAAAAPDLIVGFQAESLSGIGVTGFLTPWQVGIQKRAYRAHLEREIYGFDPRILEHFAVKYAHFFDAEDTRRVLSDYYGRVFAKLKPSLLRRALVTSADSSAEGYWDLSRPAEVRRIKSQNSRLYSEAQILGPVDLRDVEAIYLPPEHFDQKETVLRLAEQFGFKAFAYRRPLNLPPGVTRLNEIEPLATAKLRPDERVTPKVEVDLDAEDERVPREEVVRRIQAQELVLTGQSQDVRSNSELRIVLLKILNSASSTPSGVQLATDLYYRIKTTDLKIEAAISRRARRTDSRRPKNELPTELSIAQLNLNEPFQVIDLLRKYEYQLPNALLVSFYQKYVLDNFLAPGFKPSSEQMKFLARCWYRRYFRSYQIEGADHLARHLMSTHPGLKAEILSVLADQIRSGRIGDSLEEFETRWKDGWEAFSALAESPTELRRVGIIDAFRARPTPVGLEIIRFLLKPTSQLDDTLLSLAELIPPEKISRGFYLSAQGMAMSLSDQPKSKMSRDLGRRLWAFTEILDQPNRSKLIEKYTFQAVKSLRSTLQRDGLAFHSEVNVRRISPACRAAFFR